METGVFDHEDGVGAWGERCACVDAVDMAWRDGLADGEGLWGEDFVDSWRVGSWEGRVSGGSYIREESGSYI